MTKFSRSQLKRLRKKFVMKDEESKGMEKLFLKFGSFNILNKEFLNLTD